MKKVYVNNLGYLAGPSVTEANIQIEVTDEIAEKISSGPLGKLGCYNKEIDEFELVTSYDISDFRLLRENECFTVINRSFMGYLSLTEEQKNELQEGYQAGLDITETREIPKKPTGLK